MTQLIRGVVVDVLPLLSVCLHGVISLNFTVPSTARHLEGGMETAKLTFKVNNLTEEAIM